MEDSLVRQQINSARDAINDWEEELDENAADLQKFFKKGNKRAGMRVRKVLKELSDQAKALRKEISRTTAELDTFK